MGEEGTSDQGVQEGGQRGWTKGGRGWLNNRKKIIWLNTIKGIRKMYDSVDTVFNLDTDDGKNV